MRDLLKTVPNQLTAARLILIPVMWILAWLKLPFYIGLGVFISFITDVLDGYIARRLNQVTESGSKFDSLADNLLIPCGLIWLWLFRPGIYLDNLLICAIAITAYFSSIFIGLVKFRRFGNLHLYTTRAAGVTLYLFMAIALIMNHYSQPLFYLASTLFIIGSAETILLQLICKSVNDHMGSLLFVLHNRTAG